MYRHQGGGMTPGMALTMVGQQLANALSQKWARKAHHDKMTSLYEAIAGKDPETPEDLPGYSESMDLAQSLVPPGPFGVAGSIANQQNVQQNAEKTLPQVQQSRRVLKEMMTSGDPRLEEMALAQIAPKKPLRGAERYMNLGGGMVLDLADESLLNFSGEKAEEMQVLKPGDIVRDPATGEVLYQAPKDSDLKEWSVEVGVGKGMKQRAVIRSDGSQTLYGKPYSEVDRQDITTGPRMTPRATGQLETDLIDIETGKIELKGLTKRYDPEKPEEGGFNPDWLTWEGKLINKAKEVVDKSQFLAWGAEQLLSEDELEKFWGEYEAYQTWATDVSRNVNRLIKMITGAQMSEQEVPRLEREMPNIKDGPRAFTSKANSAERYLQEVYDQKMQMLQQGFIPPGVRPVDLYGANPNGTPISYAQIAQESGTKAALEAWAADKISRDSRNPEWLDKYGEPSGGSDLPAGVTIK